MSEDVTARLAQLEAEVASLRADASRRRHKARDSGDTLSSKTLEAHDRDTLPVDAAREWLEGSMARAREADEESDRLTFATTAPSTLTRSRSKVRRRRRSTSAGETAEPADVELSIQAGTSVVFQTAPLDRLPANKASELEMTRPESTRTRVRRRVPESHTMSPPVATPPKGRPVSAANGTSAALTNSKRPNIHWKLLSANRASAVELMIRAQHRESLAHLDIIKQMKHAGMNLYTEESWDGFGLGRDSSANKTAHSFGTLAKDIQGRQGTLDAARARKADRKAIKRQRKLAAFGTARQQALKRAVGSGTNTSAIELEWAANGHIIREMPESIYSAVIARYAQAGICRLGRPCCTC